MSRPPRRLVFGGSFNPIHIGHLICARAAAEKAGLDGVRLIPTAANPHKPTADLADARHRLACCRLAVENDPFFVVDDREICRSGMSYTFDTATEILQSGAEPGPKVPWLVGTDLLRRLHTWHRFEELLHVVDFVVMHRAGEPIDVEGLHPQVFALATKAILVPQIQLSATAIRKRLRHGRSIEYLVPQVVANYLLSEHVYGPDAGGSESPQST